MKRRPENILPLDVFHIPAKKKHKKPLVEEKVVKYYPAPSVARSPRSRLTARVIPASTPNPEDILKAADTLLKYQYYLDYGVGESYIIPLREAWLTRATRLVGSRARHMVSEVCYHETMVHVAVEINDVYLQSMRKAIVDYILQVLIYLKSSSLLCDLSTNLEILSEHRPVDPDDFVQDEGEQERLGLKELQGVLQAVTTGFIGIPTTVQILSQEWRDAVRDSSGSLAGIMYRLVPYALEVQELWVKTYGHKLVLDVAIPENIARMPHDIHWLVEREKKLSDDMRWTIFDSNLNAGIYTTKNDGIFSC